METQQPQAVTQQPMVTVQGDPSAANRVRTRGNWKALRVTGYLQVIAGIISILLGFIAIVFKTYLFFTAVPVWGGICFYIVAGILGIAAGGRQRNGLVAAYLIMSIIAAVVAFAMVVVAGVNISNDRFVCPDWRYLDINYEFLDRFGCSSTEGSRMAIDALILVTGIMEMAVGIVGASLTCSSLCSVRTPSQRVVYYQSAPQVMVAGQPQNVVQYAVAPQQQFVQQPQFVYPGQQVVVNPAQPQFQPLVQPQGQVAYQRAPQGHPQPPPQAQAESPAYETPLPPGKQSALPEDHHKKPLVT